MATPQAAQTAVGELQLFSQASFPEMYEQALVGPLFLPWVGPLLDDVDLQRGDRVLDVACGTGIVARVAKDRLGAAGGVVGVDVNAQMLGVARRMAPTIEWREGEAGRLPLSDGEQFDVLVCQQGFQFFRDRPSAARKMRQCGVLATAEAPPWPHGQVDVATTDHVPRMGCGRRDPGRVISGRRASSSCTPKSSPPPVFDQRHTSELLDAQSL